MSQPPKLPIATREHIAQLLQRKRILTRLIAELTDERRKIPAAKTIAKEAGVSYHVVQRLLYGEPYKNTHPADERGAQPTSQREVA